MALIAFENHAHNLQSPDSDIYKKSVEAGVRYLLNNAYDVDLSVQACIGDPEADDGDSDNDGKGVVFSRFGPDAYEDEMYIDPIAVLAMVNSCDKATAQTRTAVTTDQTRFVNGMTLWDIIVDAKDVLAFAQNEGLGGKDWECTDEDDYGVWIKTDGLSIKMWEAWIDHPTICPGFFTVNWGDGSPPEDYAGEDEECPGWVDTDEHYNAHIYAAPGTYTVSASYQGELICSVDVAVTESISGCGASGWRYERNYYGADNSVSQWPVLALEEARNRWDINVNPLVITELDGWLEYSQNPNSGGFGYVAPNDWVNFAKTAAGVAMLHYCGYDETEPRMQSALGFLNNEWDVPDLEYYGNLGNYYAGDDGTPVTPGDYSIVTKLFPDPVSRSAVLRVTDSYGLAGTSSAHFNIVSIAVVYGQEYNTCFRERISRFEARLGISVMFKNLGTSTAENLIMTLTQTPSNLQILKGVFVLGDLAPGVKMWTACDPTSMAADIELKFNRRMA